jgi:cobalt-zinc-cadmium resistance protein CzcA
MPPGYYVTYGGQFQNLVEANKRLSVAVPVALALIFVLLFFTFGSVKQSLLIFTAIPLSAIGGVFALWLRGMPFSISAGVGFIALFGVAVLNGIVLIGYFNQFKSEGMTDVLERIREGTKVRLRPVIMTAAVASLGFLPMAFSTGAGAEVQKPLATVVIGGLITATLLTLIVLPILYFLFEEKLKGRRKKALPVSVLLACLFLFSIKTSAQSPTLTLPEALEMAYKNNQRCCKPTPLKSSRGSPATGGGHFSKDRFWGATGAKQQPPFDENFSVSQDIPNPALLKARRNLAAQQTGLAQSQLAISKNELTFQIRQSWHQIQYLQALETVLMREDSLLGQFVRAASLKFKTGESNLLEKTTAETRQQQLQQSIFQVKVLIEIEKMKLQQWLNPGDFSMWKTFSPLLLPEILDSSLLRGNPLLLFAQKQIASPKPKNGWPKPSGCPISGRAISSSPSPGRRKWTGMVNYNAVPRFQGVQLGISVPIFGAKGYKAKTDAAEPANFGAAKAQRLPANAVAKPVATVRRAVCFLEKQRGVLPKHGFAECKIHCPKRQSKAYQSGDIGYVEYAQALQTNLEIQRLFGGNQQPQPDRDFHPISHQSINCFNFSIK